MGIIEESRRALLMAQLRSGGGGGRQVIGTFTATSAEKGTVKTIDLGYTGNGYPMSLSFFPSDGSYNSASEIYSRVQNYGALLVYIVKHYLTGEYAVPDYSGSGEKNQTTFILRYKNSATSGTSYTNTTGTATATYYAVDPSATAAAIVRLQSKTQMKVLIANKSYGFMDGISYTYIVTYSA